jgi:orotate phosphoribosyltransferase
MDSKEKKRLIELIKERSFLCSEKEEFVLSSGARSRYYFDMKKTTYSPEGQYLIGRLFYEKIKELGLHSRHIGGLTLGADPIATAVARYSYDMSDPIEAFVIRKEPKKHGAMRQIEGYVNPGDSVIIVEDVVTTGGSTLKAIDIALSHGLKIEAIIVLLDRCELNGRENIERKGFPFYSILTINDVIN